jgi:hypothetical protein
MEEIGGVGEPRNDLGNICPRSSAFLDLGTLHHTKVTKQTYEHN